jgi:hypothetical protein
MLSNSFKWKHYEGEIILLNLRWYLKYPLSFRNLEEMMAERGIKVDHTTLMRAVCLIFCKITNLKKFLGSKSHIGRSIFPNTQKLDFKFTANSRRCLKIAKIQRFN